VSSYRLLPIGAITLLGCTAEPAWREGEIGVFRDGLTVGAAGGCNTFIVDGLSQQLIAEQNCLSANSLVRFDGKPGVTVQSNVYPFLEPVAATALEAVAAGTPIDVTSAFRTLAQQYLLYKWYGAGQCGISLAAVPGNSNHETGTAVDLSNYSAVISAMQSQGWTHSYPTSDPVHFDYTGSNTIDLRGDSVLSFQHLWNANNPADQIAEDGSYGPNTETKLAASPATGFALGSTCGTQPTPGDGGPVSDGGTSTEDGGSSNEDGGQAFEDGGAESNGGKSDTVGHPGPQAPASGGAGCSFEPGSGLDAASAIIFLTLAMIGLTRRRRLRRGTSQGR
jgi:hypothetical protein